MRKYIDLYAGILHSIDDKSAVFTLVSTTTGIEYNIEAPSSDFAGKGIEEDGYFICNTFVGEDGHVDAEIEVIPDVEVTDDDIKKIREKIERVLPLASRHVTI